MIGVPEIILVNIGVFQEYILDNLRNLRDFGHHPTVIVDPKLASNFVGWEQDIQLISTDELEYEFDASKIGNFEKQFRGGFWQHTSQRLFIIHTYMKKYGKNSCIHIENDVMVYDRLENLDEIVGNEEKLWLTMDNEKRCIPGFMYIPSAEALQPVQESYNYEKNDMENLGNYFYSNMERCAAFPTLSKNMIRESYCDGADSCLWEKFSSRLFDAAAIGQYLGGIDGRNRPGCSRGYRNLSSPFDCSLFEFSWQKNSDNLWIPHIQVDGAWIPILNLHIHGKQLHRFMARYPIETVLIPLGSANNPLKLEGEVEFDVVIPVGPMDVEVLEGVVHHARKNIKGFRNLYILTNQAWYSSEYLETVKQNGCMVISERDAPFPFSFEEVEDACVCKGRVGWYYQQLLKLYANQGIPDLLGNYLVLDADTYIVNPVHFWQNGKPCFATGDEYHRPYFQHMAAMHPLLRKHHARSGIAHHMLFQRKYVEELRERVEEYHEGKPFWRVFLEAAKYSGCPTNGASEYEMYFNYMYHTYPDRIVVRDLSWKNKGKIEENDYEQHAYVSVHKHFRRIQVCYPYNNSTIVEHSILHNSLVESDNFVPNASYFGDHEITEAVLLDWMRDRLADLDGYVILFVMPSVLFNFNNECEIFRVMWELKYPLVSIQEKDGSENMRVLLVQSRPEVRATFASIRHLEELGVEYFNDDLIRSDVKVDMEKPWGIIDLKTANRRERLLEVAKYMDVSDLLNVL